MSVIAEISLYPIGTSDPSISKVLADSVKVLQNHGLKCEVTATSTNVEGDLDKILMAIRDMEEVPFKEGAQRVILEMKIDDRRDKPITMDYEEKSLEHKL